MSFRQVKRTFISGFGLSLGSRFAGWLVKNFGSLVVIALSGLAVAIAASHFLMEGISGRLKEEFGDYNQLPKYEKSFVIEYKDIETSDTMASVMTGRNHSSVVTMDDFVIRPYLVLVKDVNGYSYKFSQNRAFVMLRKYDTQLNDYYQELIYRSTENHKIHTERMKIDSGKQWPELPSLPEKDFPHEVIFYVNEDSNVKELVDFAIRNCVRNGNGCEVEYRLDYTRMFGLNYITRSVVKTTLKDRTEMINSITNDEITKIEIPD